MTSVGERQPSLRDRYRQTLGRFATGVTVITSCDAAGEPHGMTANAFMSVSLEPPLVAFAGQHGANLARVLTASDAFGVAILGAGQEREARRFARIDVGAHGPVPAFDDIDGIPVLRHSLAWLTCRVAARHEAGDHTLVIGRVLDMSPGAPIEAPLAFYQSTFAVLDPMPGHEVAPQLWSGGLDVWG